MSLSRFIRVYPRLIPSILTHNAINIEFIFIPNRLNMYNLPRLYITR